MPEVGSRAELGNDISLVDNLSLRMSQTLGFINGEGGLSIIQQGL
jgi:hypothetical protein